MASKQDLEELLRLITTGRVSVITAMGQVKALQAVNLRSIQQIADAQPIVVEKALDNAKKAKSLQSACRAYVTRPTIKRSGDSLPNAPVGKRGRTDLQPGLDFGKGSGNDRDGLREDALRLPVNMDEMEIEMTAIHTNRAPLLLAFALELLRYTMPEQPLSSRLSLAHAVVSANSRSKAVSLGMGNDDGAVDGNFWGEGQPKVTIMGRSIAVLKRGDYNSQQAVDVGVCPVTASHHDNLSTVSRRSVWTTSHEIRLKSSTFVARVALLDHHSQAPALVRSLLASEPRLKAATHNVWAYRVSGRAHDRGTALLREGCEDDGETGGGEFILRLMREAHVVGALVVLTRWFGGEMLGSDRWRIIRECVTGALSGRMRLPDDQGHIEVALWALDLQRVNDRSGMDQQSAGDTHRAGGAEIYRPESARAYLYKSFASPRVGQNGEPVSGKMPLSRATRVGNTGAAIEAHDLQNLGRLLGALRLLYESWATHLTPSEMDQRAWSWYAAVRPDIDPGPSGWGAKDWIKLSTILDLRWKEETTNKLVNNRV